MLATTLLLAVEEGAEGIELFPEPPELIWGLVAFLILMALMMKFVFPKANEALEARSAAIQGRLAEASAKLTEAEEAKRAYEASIADAQGEANRVIEEAKATGEALRAEIVAKAETEAAAIVERAHTDVAGERERVVQDLRSQVGAISVELASRIVERELDPATHQGLVDDYIARLSSQN